VTSSNAPARLSSPPPTFTIVWTPLRPAVIAQ
jgi:hypothetical protein